MNYVIYSPHLRILEHGPHATGWLSEREIASHNLQGSQNHSPPIEKMDGKRRAGPKCEHGHENKGYRFERYELRSRLRDGLSLSELSLAPASRARSVYVMTLSRTWISGRMLLDELGQFEDFAELSCDRLSNERLLTCVSWLENKTNSDIIRSGNSTKTNKDMQSLWSTKVWHNRILACITPILSKINVTTAYLVLPLTSVPKCCLQLSVKSRLPIAATIHKNP